ncbi:DUF2269 domain-containing protein [Corynebacterium sp. NML98-0116]|uniref:DUF2269 family protein n=1 Tax=Corynebacterium TaxID=1716 RepID=UPI0008783ADE|nr:MULTISPECIES: DUF2269 family protein [Corynebacterium]AOX05786.1 DUF2269 domain-containing protein [Corynebacterium sp. NML98-0116]MCQ4607067.1 DUF2269 family protein [Corynebacterium pseudogenitalium]MCQ4609444.1 DUF2269 family protein [Corynebacterium sp. CCUG 61414]MDK8363539.1 DUF2269 family protein [Corynebacterium sp. UMB10119B]
MTTLLTFLHVAAAILLLGPIVVSTSMFPRQAAEAQAGDAAAAGRASILYRISRTYGIASSLVPLLGVAILFGDWAAYKTNYFLHTSIVLAVIAWALLLFVVIPTQRKMVGTLGELEPAEADPADVTANFEKSKAKASAFAGVFNLLWFIVLVLMFLPAPTM